MKHRETIECCCELRRASSPLAEYASPFPSSARRLVGEAVCSAARQPEVDMQSQVVILTLRSFRKPAYELYAAFPY